MFRVVDSESSFLLAVPPENSYCPRRKSYRQPNQPAVAAAVRFFRGRPCLYVTVAAWSLSKRFPRRRNGAWRNRRNQYQLERFAGKPGTERQTALINVWQVVRD